MKMMGMGFGFGLFGLLFMLLFWGGLIVLAIWVVGNLFPSSRPPHRSISERDMRPGDILDMRYARGEITREQYELMKKDLKQAS
jgi:putative membrane protein